MTNACRKAKDSRLNKKEKKKVKGWSTEEMKEKPSSSFSLAEDTEEMKTWRGMSQEKMDQCWKRLAGKMTEEVLNKCMVDDSKRGADRGSGFPLEWRRVRNSRKYRIRKWGEDCWAIIFALFRECNLQRRQSKQDELTEEEEMKQQQRMAIMKNLIKTIRSKGRMDVQNRWWVTELLATDCEKAWIHTGWEDTVQKWYEWLEYKKRKDEKKKVEDVHQHKVEQMIKSAEGSAGLLHKITKPTL